VVAADLPSTALKAGPAKTASGLSAFVSIKGATVKVNDATVTTADVKASNGVIHVIDKVLLPPNIPQAAAYAGSFSTLLGAAEKAGLVGALSAADANLTVFAPTDAAFDAIKSTVASLTVPQLTDVLKYHVVAGKVLSTDLKNGSVPTLLANKTLNVSLTSGVKINDANVVVADVVTTNGVIHVVDKVLVPN
jgi:transforming growth factor-beta-induced protein